MDAPRATHEVTNQVAPLAGFNAWTADAVLRDAVSRAGGGWIAERADAIGALVGDERMQALAEAANTNVPVLRTHDRLGNRVDTVEYHPAYHELMGRAFGAGCHSLAWTAHRDGAFVGRAALNYLWNQLEQGTSCPVTMTFAGVHVLRNEPSIAAVWEPKLTTAGYDPRPLELADKTAATIGMAMTEKQGGSDLRMTQTKAEPAGDGSHLLTGHKWFCSAPMSDAFLTLARTDAGVTCFLLPRSLPDGRRNAIRLQRLKDKIGNRSNASSELEFDQAQAWRVGPEGRGIATLIEMAHLTRFDIIVAAAGMMRAMLNQASHHAAGRAAFGRLLADQPLMRNVLADLTIEVEAATLLAFRVASAFDRALIDEHERGLARVMVPIAKYWLCKRLSVVAVEAMECIGGNGYVQEHPVARLYREAPLNGIWEGSANVICLDVLRVMQKEPDALATFFDELAEGADAPLNAHLRTTRAMLADTASVEANARRVIERLAIALQARLVADHAPDEVRDAFAAGRLDRETGLALGTLPARLPLAALAARGRIVHP